MADYIITGKKGNGKTLFAVGLIRDALREGKRVATNLDIRPEAFGRWRCRGVITRIPDRPTAEDFEALGRGQNGVIEEDNGLLILDETSTFFNTRSYGDKSRQPMLDWLVHSRKYGWNVYYICQGEGQIDKQIRESGVEYHIPVKRTDKWAIPVITGLTETLGYRVGFPKVHLGIIFQGLGQGRMFCGRKWYRGKDLYAAYDTQQIFYDRGHPKAMGMHSVLSAWHMKGRYMSWWERTKPALLGSAVMGFALGVGVAVAVDYAHGRVAKTTQADKFASAASDDVVGEVHVDNRLFAVLGSGQMVAYSKFRKVDDEFHYLIGDAWHKARKP